MEIGGNKIAVMAGPCSVESESRFSRLQGTARLQGPQYFAAVPSSPEAHPMPFRGSGWRGLDMLKAAGRRTGMPIVSEIMSTDYLDRFIQDVDIIQVGARNMQKFCAAKELSHIKNRYC